MLGTIGDVECKRKLIDVLVNLIEPFRLRRIQYEKDMDFVRAILKEGTTKANDVANDTLVLAKDAMKQRYY